MEGGAEYEVRSQSEKSKGPGWTDLTAVLTAWLRRLPSFRKGASACVHGPVTTLVS